MGERGKAFAITLGLVLAACASGITSEHEADPEADFSRYATYAWIGEGRATAATDAGSSPQVVSPLGQQRIRRAVDARLATRGYRPAGADTADLLVSFSVASQRKTSEEQIAGRSTVIAPGDGRGQWQRNAPVRTRTYTEGTLTLEFFERESGRPVWTGWASKALSAAADREQVIRHAVEAILEDFPARR